MKISDKKQIGIGSILLFLLVLPSFTTIFMVGMNTNLENNGADNTSLTEENTNININTPISASKNFNVSINGTGVNRPVHIYLNNSDDSSGMDGFDIPTEADNEYLENGEFLFNFTDINYDTEYVLEDDSPMQRPYNTDEDDNTTMTLDPGDHRNGLENNTINNKNYDNFVEIWDIGGEIGLNFSSDLSNLNLNDLEVLGFKYTITLESTKNLDLNIYGKNYDQGTWDLFSENLRFNKTGDDIDGNYVNEIFYFENKNLNFINPTNGKAEFSFKFSNSSGNYIMGIYEIRVLALVANEIAIKQNQSLALEFDTKGDSYINGFTAWVRSFNTSSGSNTLTVGLYNSNETEVILRSELMDKYDEGIILIEPTGEAILEKTYTNFEWDEEFYFEFDTPSSKLPTGNYFIVISSDVQDGDDRAYSLVTLPNSLVDNPQGKIDPDNQIDHLLLKNSTGDWESNYITAPDYTVDAALFKINLTRGKTATELNASIDGELIQNTFSNKHPADTEGDYAQDWWGLGYINHEFSEQIKAESSSFTVPITTDDMSISMDVEYNVTKYVEESATVEYSLHFDNNPRWNVSFNMIKEDYANWNFKGLSIFIPDNWDNDDYNYIVLPNGTMGDNTDDIYEISGLDYMRDYVNIIGDQIEYKLTNKTYLGENWENVNGIYNLYAESENYLTDANYNLKYEEDLYETTNFMPGDDIAASLSVTNLGDSSTDFVSSNSGIATIRLYDLDDIQIAVLNDNFSDLNSSEESATIYEFNNDILLATTTEDPGTYNGLFSWTNGEQAGLIRKKLMLNNYTGLISSIEHVPNAEENRIIGKVFTAEGISEYYLNLVIVEDITDNTPSNNYTINETLDMGLNNNINLLRYAQNETFLNAGEQMYIKVELENTNATLDFNVEVVVELKSVLNPDWVIVTNTSNLQELKLAGDPSDTKEFTIALDIPTMAEGGINCPIRYAPMYLETYILVNGEKIESSLYTRNSEEKLLYYSNTPDSVFEGRIITSQVEPIGSETYITGIDYSKMELPKNNTYYMSAYNSEYLTMDHEVSYEIEEKAIMNIDYLEIEQSDIDIGSQINVLGQLSNIFNISVENITLNLIYKNDSDACTWDSITPENGLISTDEDGKFDAEIDLSKLTLNSYELELQIKLIESDQFYSTNLTIYQTINQYNNSLDISTNVETLISGYTNIITFVITNNGNSTIDNIIIYYSSPFDGNILNNGSQIEELKAGEKVKFQIELKDESYNEQEVIITITVNVDYVETNTNMNTTQTFTMDVIRVNTHSLRNTIIVVGFLLSVIAFWMYTINYIEKKYKEVNSLTEEDKETLKKGKGKYVSVSDLKRKDKSKKGSAKPEPSKSKNKKTQQQIVEEKLKSKKDSSKKDKSSGVSLDSLLDKED